LPQPLFHLRVLFGCCRCCGCCGCTEVWHCGSPRVPSGLLHDANPCRALLRPSRTSKSPHLWICVLSVKSKHHGNTGLISPPQYYSENPIPSRSHLLNPEEFLPGDGKIFTISAPSARRFAR
jgi:hypothetical protein